MEDGRLTLGVAGIQRFEEKMTDRQLEAAIRRVVDFEETIGGDDDTSPVELNGAEQQTEFRDALTGQLLVPELVREARRRELEYFVAKRVWVKVPREEAKQRQGKPPISIKWVDVNKGDDDAPNYRSRLVAREVRQAWEDTIFSPTPPLESLRSILSLAATDLPERPRHDRRPESPTRTQVSVIDISRAYFNAVVEESKPTFVELPHEDPDRARGMCGQIRVHLYGTRPAAKGWHTEFSESLEEMGFTMGIASACVFRHEERSIATSVYGDDFLTEGPKDQLDWFKGELEKKYELTESARLGPGSADDKEARVLNRVVR